MAIISSVLCRRPEICIKPSLLPHTKTRPPYNKEKWLFHWFYCQHGGNYVICIMSSTWDLHQTLLTTTNENSDHPETKKIGYFIGSTANTVTIMSSVLCRRPEICIKPSLLPHTKTRPPWNKEKWLFHWFYRQHRGNYVICIMSSTWDLHQSLLTSTNENKTTLKQRKMVISLVLPPTRWQLCHLYYVFDRRSASNPPYYHKRKQDHLETKKNGYFIGSTANTVAIMSSVLCLRPEICIKPSLLPQTKTRPPWNKEKWLFHWFYRQHGSNYVICIMSSTWDLHQTLLTTTNENKTTLKQRKMVISLVLPPTQWQLCHLYYVFDLRSASNPPYYHKRKQDHPETKKNGYFIGSTTNTVAIMPSVLCLRPEICIKPSLLPHTKKTTLNDIFFILFHCFINQTVAIISSVLCLRLEICIKPSFVE